MFRPALFLSNSGLMLAEGGLHDFLFNFLTGDSCCWRPWASCRKSTYDAWLRGREEVGQKKWRAQGQRWGEELERGSGLFYYSFMLGQRGDTFGSSDSCKSDNSWMPQGAAFNTGATDNLDPVIGKIEGSAKL